MLPEWDKAYLHVHTVALTQHFAWSPVMAKCGCCSRRTCCSRKALYIIGLILLGLGCASCVAGFFSKSWVYREGGSTLTAKSVEHYGLWTACSPDSFDVCNHLYDAMPEVEGAARGSQALITISTIFYVFCFAVETILCCPFGLRQKLSIIFENHIVEYIIAIAAVIGFLGMLIFAAEVKNKASREIGQLDQTGKGFGWSLTGQILVVIGCCLLACGRDINKGKTLA